ncbi:hypothetical protein [Citrobacter werkmanii]|uniref:hypothetical protein n=1 Tax=Citrobacter werkmanii TaxID=67827 RepID=UPI001EF228DF|nr:hypothetical protein [Citrobacter werkmanii]
MHLLFSSQINLAGDSGGDKGGAAFFEQGDTLFRLANQCINAGGFAVEGGDNGGLFIRGWGWHPKAGYHLLVDIRLAPPSEKKATISALNAINQ